MAILQTEREKLTRYHIPLTELKGAEVTGLPVVSEIVDYSDGNERSYVLEKYAKRYCERITKRKSSDSSDTDDLFYSDPVLAAKAAVDTGKFEVVTLGTLTKIKRIVASLNRDVEFSYVNEAGDEDEQFAKDMQETRQAGAFSLKLGRMDELAVVSGAAGAVVQQLGSKLDYQPLQSNQIKIVHATDIMEGDNDRPTNTLDIEEASLCVLEMSPASGMAYNYVAYFPRSDEYPRGRMVKYESTNWFDIPEIGAEGAQDYYEGEEIANPLTVLQDESKDWTVPEIPVVLWQGTVDGVGVELLPTNTTLYEQDKEINLAASRQLFAGIRSATGVIAFSTELGGSPIISDNIGEATSMLRPGQSLNILSVPGSNTTALMDAVEKNIAYLGESFAVPAYKLTVSQNTQVPSGVALVELTKPESQYRQTRANINRQNMDRIFRIERGLAARANGNPAYGAGIKQIWTVKDPAVTYSDIEKLDILLREKQAGIIDEREIVRQRLPQFADATDEEIDLYLDGLRKAPAAPPAGTGRFGRAVQAAQGPQ